MVTTNGFILNRLCSLFVFLLLLGWGFQGIETYAILVFYKALIVTADRNEEEKAVDVLEAVNPLLSFGPLATNVEHSVC
jgi:hypothetical protein